MTSAINPNNINDAYPIAGQPNNTQGFRDNFAATKTNFEAASSEITELQTKSVLTAALTGGSALTTQNNMLGAPLIGAKIRNFSADTVNIATTSGPIAVDYSQGHYQRIATTGNIGLSFTNWPTSGSYGSTILQLNIDSAGRTVTIPAAVTYGTAGIQGLANSVITFASAGTYQFEFNSSDGGGNITIQDLNRPLTNYTNAFGYTSGAGGTVTQLTNKSTGVTLNKPAGEITMNNASLSAATTVTFTLTNSAIAATDVLIINQTSTANAGGYHFNAVCNAGNAYINVRNIMASAAADAVVIRYALIKGSPA